MIVKIRGLISIYDSIYTSKHINCNCPDIVNYMGVSMGRLDFMDWNRFDRHSMASYYSCYVDDVRIYKMDEDSNQEYDKVHRLCNGRMLQKSS